MSNTDLHTVVERIRAATATEYAEKHHVRPRAFVLSGGTPPVRVDPNFSLPVDQSKAEFVQAIKQTVKRLNANAVLTVSASWLTKLVSPVAGSSQPPTVVEVVLATLSQREGPDTIWIAAIEQMEGSQPLLKEWVESRPQGTSGGLFFHFASEKLN